MKIRRTSELFRDTQVSLLFVTGALFLGLSFYLLLRPEDSAPILRFLPTIPNISNANRIAQALNWLPSLLHVFIFAVMTWTILGRRYALLSAGVWCAIDLLFEFAQCDPDLVNMFHIFYGGTFDVADVGACILGAAAAWAMSRM